MMSLAKKGLPATWSIS
ncbi:Protein of unknown function [Bacillus mycoides]|nr:Protein of unknown function [Bacillus mycoides]